MDAGNRFSRCLLDRRDEESQNARRLRRRTLLLAILIQALILTLLMLRPLLGAQQVPLLARLAPLPPWKAASVGADPGVRPHSAIRHPGRTPIAPAPILWRPLRLQEHGFGEPPEGRLGPRPFGWRRSG